MGCVKRNVVFAVGSSSCTRGSKLPPKPSPPTMHSEDEALLVLASHVQRHTRVCARAGRLQVRELQHP